VPVSSQIRFDSGVTAGSSVSPYYDSMIAKLIVQSHDREAARLGLIDALDRLELGGIATNQSYLRDILAHEDVAAGKATTAWLDAFRPWDEAPGERQLLNLLAAVAIDHVIGIEEERGAEIGDDPWGSLGGWRLLSAAGHPARLPIELEDQAGQRHRVAVEGTKGRYAIAIGGAPIPVSARRTPEGLVMNAGHHGRTVQVRSDGRQVQARIGGLTRSFRIVGTGELDHAAAGAAGGGDILAAMPGLVVEILAKVGDTVEAGQPIIVMEAMKMMHGLAARGPGVIAEIGCRPGEAVEMGRTLVRMTHETAKEAAP
jgi:3-methylcrotonyl-CoA carboxylase alpha subunit